LGLCVHKRPLPRPQAKSKMDNESCSELRKTGPGCDKEGTRAIKLGVKSGEQKKPLTLYYTLSQFMSELNEAIQKAHINGAEFSGTMTQNGKTTRLYVT
jgi:hypothetical protein